MTVGSRPPHLPDGPFARIAGFSARRWRPVLAGWLVLMMVLGVFAPRLEHELTPGGFEIGGSDSQIAREIIRRDFTDRFPTGVTLVVSSPDRPVSDPRFQAVVDAAARAMAARRPLVGGVVTPARDPSLAFPERRIVLISVGFTRGLDEALRDVGGVIRAARAAGTPDVQVEVTGGPAVFEDFNAVNKQDLTVSESIQIPFIVLVLVLFFGSLVSGAVPLAATAAAIVSTLGGLYFLAHETSLSIYVQNIVLLIGIGVGIDYSLFVVSRFRDELRRRGDPVEAAAVTGATAGKAIFFSGLTVAVALAGMLAVRVPLFTGMAVGTMAVVAAAVAAGLTFTPALLTALAPHLDRADLGPLLRRLMRRPAALASAEASVNAGFWMRWANGVMRRPWPVVIATTAVLLALAAPALWMRTGSSGITALPPDQPSRLAAARVVAAAGEGAVSRIEVVVTGSAAPLTAADPGIRALMSRLSRDPQVASVDPRVSVSRDRRSAIVTVTSRHGDDDERSQDLVGRILSSHATAIPAPGTVHVGGAAAQNRDFTAAVSGSLVRVILLVMGLTFVVLVVLFRSVLLPLKAVVMTLLSALAAYGVLVMVFQWGWADAVLGFEHLGHVSNWVPAFLFSILFGLSMDYEVFLLTRVREQRDRGLSDTEAVAAGLAGTGRIISAAATLMVIVFVSFLSNRLVPMKELALGLAVAVFLDATLVRLLLVPAFMRLAGAWNWWLPRPLERILPRIEG